MRWQQSRPLAPALTSLACLHTLSPAPLQTPQFVVLSHDDAITVTTKNAVHGVVNQFANSNGCAGHESGWLLGALRKGSRPANGLLALGRPRCLATPTHPALSPTLCSCNVPFTFFTSGGAGSNCAIMRRLLADNHELATHTLAHVGLAPGAAGVDITAQVVPAAAL